MVYVPFAASIVAAVLSRIGSRRLWPRAAVWAITVSSAALALCTVGALVVLASPLPAQVPLIAHAGRWRPTAVASHTPIPWSVSAVALASVVVLAWRLVRELLCLVRDGRAAAALTRAVSTSPGRDVVIVDGDTPGAHAVGLGLTGRGVIVMTSSMLSLLDADEHAAVVAHERSHLRHRHTLFAAAVRLAAAANPLLASARRDLRFALERAADEAAAAQTDRNTVARALLKSALGMLETRPLAAGMAFHRHELTARAAAMLDEQNQRSRPAWTLLAVAVGAGLALAWATHDTERFFEAVRLWSRP